MAAKLLVILLSVSYQTLAADGGNAPATIASGVMLNWSLGLLLVLAIFMLCVFGLRKLNGAVMQGGAKMRIVSGISLGMREKVLLLQVGKKQLVLGVTPGRIETLHVLEGDDCLANETDSDGSFAQKLMQAVKVRSDA
ncbi:MAG: flagellar biosynthetic protein FliO [Methylococcales bacterium]